MEYVHIPTKRELEEAKIAQEILERRKDKLCELIGNNDLPNLIKFLSDYTEIKRVPLPLTSRSPICSIDSYDSSNPDTISPSTSINSLDSLRSNSPFDLASTLGHKNLLIPLAYTDEHYTSLINLLGDDKVSERFELPHGDNILHLAVRLNNPQLIEALLKSNIGEQLLSQFNKEGLTPWHLSIHLGQTSIAYLIEGLKPILNFNGDEKNPKFTYLTTLTDKANRTGFDIALEMNRHDLFSLTCHTFRNSAQLTLFQIHQLAQNVKEHLGELVKFKP